jgi:vacuolar-type H+-ATPase subunit F/Vma7
MTAIRLIGDADTVLAFALGGVPGQVTESAAEAEAAVGDIVRLVRSAGGLLQCPTLLLITHGVAAMIRSYLNDVMLDPAAPVVVEIPGFGEPLGTNPLAAFVRRAVGVPL